MKNDVLKHDALIDKRVGFAFLIILLVPALLVLWPQIDLAVAALFYRPGYGFPLAHQGFFILMQGVAYYGARLLAVGLAGLLVLAALRRAPIAGIAARGWLFLFLGLLLAPGLMANVLFKDHWGRARPREVVEFGGTQAFTPPLIPQANPHKNGSFISGDASFGFYLPSVAYVVPRPRSRRVFAGGLGLAALFGLCRIVAGAHFLSDVVFAACLTTLALALLHAALFGWAATEKAWRLWLGLDRPG